MALDLEATTRSISKWEGFRPFVYDDAKPNVPYKGGPVKGTLSVGYGETRKDIIDRYRTKEITQPEAWELLKQRVREFNGMMRLLLGPVPLTEHQEGALTSLVYNIGPGNDARKTGWKYSPVLGALKAGDFEAAAAAFLHHNKAGGKVLTGLTNRRREEAAWFRSGTPSVAPGKPGLPSFEDVKRGFERWDGLIEGPRSNETVFNDWYYGRKVFGKAFPWCATFQSYGFYHAGMPTPATITKGFAYTPVGCQNSNLPTQAARSYS